MRDPIDVATAAFLGALQGVTEFLPVSSDGHIAIGALLVGIPDMSLSMVVLLHAGTLVATFLVLREDVTQLAVETVRGLKSPSEFLRTEQGRIVAGVVLASIPTAIIGLLLEDHVEAWSHVPWIVGVCLLGSALALALTRRARGEAKTLSPGAYFLIGIAQGLAVLPGLSRSGSTIALGMLLGLRGPDAFRFSFLLSLPAVLGAVLLKVVGEPRAVAELGTAGLVGGAVAMVVGLGALVLLRRIVMQGRFWAFALYLVPLGLALIAWSASE